MGVVYKGGNEPQPAGRTQDDLAGQWATPEARHRFRAEAESAAILRHPNIVPHPGVGEHDGHQDASIGFLRRENLAKLVREKPLSAERAASYVKTIAEAVQFARRARHLAAT